MRRKCLGCAALAALLTLLWQFSVVRVLYGGNWTALFLAGDRFPPPGDLAAGTYVTAHSTGYDGQFYRYAAHDPFFRKGYWKQMDNPRLRYGRILVPAAAHFLAAGRKQWIDASYILVIAASVFLGTYWCSRILAANGRNPAWGLIFLLLPATLTSLDRMLVDGTLAALFAGFLLCSASSSWRRVYVVAMLAALTRETGLLLVAAPVAAFVWGRDVKRALWFATSALPALVWHAFVALNTGPSHATHILALPAVGLVRRVLTPRTIPREVPAVQLAVQFFDLVALLGFVTCLILGVRWALREESKAIGICVGLFVALGLVLGSPPMVEAYGWARLVSPLLLYVMLRGCAMGWRLALLPPLAVSASVGLMFVSPAYRVVRSLVSGEFF